MSCRIPITVLFAIGAAALLQAPASAQVQAVRQVIASGATATTDGTRIVVGTIGQALIGPAASSTHIGRFGFWYTYPAGTSGIRPDPGPVATGSSPALQLWPNTVSDRAEIHLQLPSSGIVSLRVYDALGRERMTLLDGHQAAGASILDLSVEGLESGSYTLVLLSGSKHVVSQLQVIR